MTGSAVYFVSFPIISDGAHDEADYDFSSEDASANFQPQRRGLSVVEPLNVE